MAKNLKIIVEEGFARLQALSEKRKELLNNCQEQAGGAVAQRNMSALQRLASTEITYVSEIQTHVDKSQESLVKTLAQIIEDNVLYFESLKQHLRFELSRLSKELVHLRDSALSESLSDFESSIRPLEREVVAGTTEIQSEVLKFIGQLEAFCKRSQSSLHESQAEIAGRLSTNERTYTAALGTRFNELMQDSERQRKQLTGLLEDLYTEQSDKMSSLTADVDERISKVVGRKLDTIKTLGKTVNTSLDKAKEEVLSSTLAKISSVSKETINELQDTYEFSWQELSDKLAETQLESEVLAQSVTEFLGDLLKSTKDTGDRIFSENTQRILVETSNKKDRVELDEAGKQFVKEVELGMGEMKRRTLALQRLQSERLSDMVSSTETTILSTLNALQNELRQAALLNDQSWFEREQELVQRIKKLEKQASAIYSNLAESTEDLSSAEGV